MKVCPGFSAARSAVAFTLSPLFDVQARCSSKQVKRFSCIYTLMTVVLRFEIASLYYSFALLQCILNLNDKTRVHLD